MIRKLRRKFVAIMMTIVVVFLSFIFLSMFFTSRAAFERRQMETVLGVTRRYENVRQHDGARGDRGQEWLPVAVASADDEGTITLRENRVFSVTDEEMQSYAAEAAQSESEHGTLGTAGLDYHRIALPDGQTFVILVDTAVERESLRSQVLSMALIFALTVGLFFGVSILLSRWVVKPVEKAWEDQRRFVADASHELKTPLTVVLSNADMMKQSGAVTDDKNKRRLDNIKEESKRMKGLVESLLTLARSDTGAGAKVRERINLSYVVTCALLTFEPAVFDAGRTLSSHIAEDRHVMGDESKLRQLLDILLENACKYSEKQSNIHVALADMGRHEVTLTVRSEGTPIPPSEREAIFLRFYRADASRGEESGYGLGLSIAQAIVEEHGGKLGVRCEDEHSNTFFVTLACDQ